MMNKQTLECLELIVEKAEKLRAFGLESQVREVGLGFSAQRQADDTWQIEFGLPDEEKRDAFVLTFRFFHQANEPTSFHRILDVGNDPDLSDHWRQEAARLRQAWFEYLDGHSDYTVNLFEGQPTRGQMLDIGLYGGLTHANRAQRVDQYREWTRDGVRANLFWQEFTGIMLTLLKLIYELCDLSRLELQQDAG